MVRGKLPGGGVGGGPPQVPRVPEGRDNGPGFGNLCLMVVTGARNADIAGFGELRCVKGRTPAQAAQPDHNKGGPWTVLADVVISKTRKSPDDKVLLTLKGKTCVFGLFPAVLQLPMIKWDRASHKEVGKVLSWMRTQPLLAKYTTYTFRRCFIHTIIDAFKNEDGSIDWKKVTEFTLHFSEKTVKSVYARSAGETVLSEDSDDE